MDAIPDSLRGKSNPDCANTWIGHGVSLARGSAHRCIFCGGMGRSDNPVFLITFAEPVGRPEKLYPGEYCQGCVKDYGLVERFEVLAPEHA